MSFIGCLEECGTARAILTKMRVICNEKNPLTLVSSMPIFDTISWHECDGAVAQLGERVNGIHEVEGSIPFSSTKLKASESAALRLT